MKKEYDFSKGKKNPYYEFLKKQQITINLDPDVIAYFKNLSKDNGIPYQNLINLYLKDCTKNKKKLTINWK